jgi:hypothetical protein
MTLESKIAKIFNLDNQNWLKHANPWSVYTRYSVLPLLIISFWSRQLIGWWCLIPGILSMLWMYFNPILFKQPKSTDNWASKAVFGERVFSNRKETPIPEVHDPKFINGLLHSISSLGMIISIWAVVDYSIWGAIYGTSLSYLGKSWYLDRMVWIYEDMKHKKQEYANWEYSAE